MAEPQDGLGEQPFWVVGPRGDITPDQLQAIGYALRAWQDCHPYASRVYGLDNLTAGRLPESPASYILPLADIYPQERWPVALLTVTPGTDLKSATSDLAVALAGCRHLLADFTDPFTYDDWTR